MEKGGGVLKGDAVPFVLSLQDSYLFGVAGHYEYHGGKGGVDRIERPERAPMTKWNTLGGEVRHEGNDRRKAANKARDVGA